MIDLLDVIIFSEQPTTCMKCGVRTDIILDLSHTVNKTQIHKCPNGMCKFEFMIQFDEDFENNSLL